MNTLFYFTISICLFSILGLACVLLYRMEKRIAARRLFSITRYKASPSTTTTSQATGKAALLSILAKLPLQFMRQDSLPRRLACAGFRSPQAVDIFIAARVAAPLTGLLLALIFVHKSILLVLISAAGYLVPDLVLRRYTAKRRAEIRDSLPDAIDLLVICVDAGLGMDQALHRVTQELSLRHPAITEEFTQLNLEQRAGKPRMQAWQAMAERLAVDEITGFMNMLIQTERFGTPIGRALSNFAENMREKRRQRAEEKAAKTAVKITLPLALFIFPSIFVVLLGPAFLSLLHNFPTLGR